MSTEKQIIANILNAQKSTGPKTDEGKKRSSLNALRHGLTGQVLVLPQENLDAFNKFTAGIVASLKPADDVEKQLAVTYAVTQNKINRGQNIEENLFTLGNIEDLAGNLNLEMAEPHNAMCDVRLFMNESRTIEKIALYTARLVRQAAAILKDLKALQAERMKREQAEMDEAIALYLANKVKKTPFEPLENGFVLTTAQIETQIARKQLVDPAYIADKLKKLAA